MTLTFVKTSAILILVTLHGIAAQAQTPRKAINIPMEPAHWQYDTAGAEFITYQNYKAVHIKQAPPLIPKNVQFSNGTIEFDAAFGYGFPGITFRISPDGRNADHFYLRYFGTTSPHSRVTLQYSAMIDSMSLWDLTDEYQAGAALRIPGWNHVRLVISGKQMRAYVNDMTRPALIVPALEGSSESGRIAFSGGEIYLANLVITPNAVEDLSPVKGYVSAYNDTRYLRNWQVSKAFPFPFGQDVAPRFRNQVSPHYPDSTTTWTPSVTEDRGILNLTRALGATDFRNRRLAWAKTVIESDSTQDRLLHMGFSDEMWLFVNGELVHVDKNHFGTPGQKFPQGRCTIENTVVKLPLKKGKNEILVGLSNYFYGWGLIARLDATDGLRL
ncbi:hypothetical protein MKQ68_03635 [Chitinophaga horti]|uniref:DUF1080 domain-containing protein n=1 Tax=Chitinophaga horti TaxID=2920382 RepID=A0ABY6J3H0_9BACT|nr:hypothetical protein [Chitinophaga horti]UYQ94182.1 hypothetical protein MKQ68_03635 [Chitinophaga horti]